jgi:hypothetical protein
MNIMEEKKTTNQLNWLKIKKKKQKKLTKTETSSKIQIIN